MTTRRRLRSQVLIVFILTLIFLAVLLVFDPDGLSDSSSGVRASGIRELAVFEAEPEMIAVAQTSQDFDGDGAFDIVGRELHTGDTWWGGTVTTSTLYVETLAGEGLLELPSESGATASWFGDHDGNGTMDVLFELGDEWRVYGFVSE